MKQQETVVLEGFHVCKHAVRFGADIIELITADQQALIRMLDKYAGDIQEMVMDQVQVVPQEQFDEYTDIQIRTPLAGRAYIPKIGRSNLPITGLVVVLDNPRDQGNIGAVVRLAAGMNVGAVITTGDVDPWHKNCLRGAQGLQFALPVFHIDHCDETNFKNRPVYVFDESGDDLSEVSIPADAVLVFGSERQGVSDQWLNKADTVVKIPQRDGVSSYNLATSVAMGVYHANLNDKI